MSLLPSTTHRAAVMITDAPSICAENIKRRINSSEVLITALLLLWTFALYMTLQ